MKMADENNTRMQIRLSPTLYGEVKKLAEVSGANLNSTMCFLMTLGLGVFEKKVHVTAAREDLAKSAEIAPV